MKQVLQSYRTGELSVADVPAPGIEAGCLLVLTRTSLVSAGTERATVELAKKPLWQKARERPDLVRKVFEKVKRDGLISAGKATLQKLDSPLPLGYSCAGIVIAVGDGIHDIAVGDRVACAGAKAASHAEVNLVPRNLCAKIPANVSDESAAFVTLGAIALHGVRQAAPTLGESFVVIGLGLIGQLVVQLLRASGCSVVGIDLDPVKVALAKSLGCEEALLRSDDVMTKVRAFTEGRGADGVVIAASAASSDPISLAGELCRDRGRVVALGAVGLEVPRRPYYEKELVLLQSRSYGPGRYDPSYEENGVDYPVGYVRWTEGRNLDAFLQQLGQGRLKLESLVSHRFPIERASEAYQLLEAGGNPLGIILSYAAEGSPSREVKVVAKPLREGELRVGLIGAGNFASGTLAPLLVSTPNARLTAIASARGVTARHLAEKSGAARATTNGEALLIDPDLDALVIATRHHLHATQTESALRAGKHVYVEKPLALDDEGISKCLAAQRATGAQLVVGFNRRFAPLTLELVNAFSGRRSALMIQIRVNAGEIPNNSWVHDPREGGGRLVGEGCHFVDLCQAIAGARVTQVFAQSIGPAGGARADDNFTLSLQLADGSVGQIVYAATGDASAGKERIEVIGAGTLAVLDDFRKLEIFRGGKSKVSRALSQDKGHAAAIAAFVRAAKGGPPAMPLVELECASRATLAALRSLRTGIPERVEPEI
jgi:predicted dehydrogenase/threonine dehydrogenase-like Zn-dependent dehydrogenase